MVAHWVVGATRTGKTQSLVDFAEGTEAKPDQPLLVFAANGDNRMTLAARLADQLGDRVSVLTTTPAGFIQDEVLLFWPLLVQQLAISPQFPLKLRPENEQALAACLWRPYLERGELAVESWREARIVRRTLDFLQLASQGGIALEDISHRLQAGVSELVAPSTVWSTAGEALTQWLSWCLQRGLLTYGIMSHLYWQHLLPIQDYRQKLLTRFCGILADDVDDYPAITLPLFSVFLEAERPCVFTYNPQGQVRLGFGADPGALQALADRCKICQLPVVKAGSLGRWGDRFLSWVEDPLTSPELPAAVSLIQETSRGHMLRTVAEAIAAAIEHGWVKPAEVAVIGPGLDAIGRYSLIEILTRKGIAIESLNDQRPLITSPMVRAVLTLLALIYPGLGRLINRDAIAEMLVVLSQSLSRLASLTQQPVDPNQAGVEAELTWFELVTIDPVRAELLADHCFVPDIQRPHLLPAETFARWDRLGHQATDAYRYILQWIETQKQLSKQRLTTSPVMSIDRIIQDFLWRGNHLPYDQLSTLRELMETAQSFWQVEARLSRFEGPPKLGELSPVGRFIELLQKGTVSANPYPVKPLAPERKGVTLSTIYQYRTGRLSHRWQFWLDAGSPLWAMGSGELFGAPIFLGHWPGRPMTIAELEAANEAQLGRTLHDLLGRAGERVFLCHSELALTGQEQMGPLLPLIGAARPADDLMDLITEDSPKPLRIPSEALVGE